MIRRIGSYKVIPLIPPPPKCAIEVRESLISESKTSAMFFKTATRLCLLQSSVLRSRGFHGSMGMAQALVSTIPKFLTTAAPSSFASVYLVPMFQDNYGFIIVDNESKVSACIDPGDGKAIKQALDALNIDLDYILCTHKHDDHIGGVADLLKDYPSAVVIATQYEEIPEADRDVGEGETFHLGKLPVQVMHTPCHTKGHIAYLVRPPRSLAVNTEGLACAPPGSFQQPQANSSGQHSSLGAEEASDAPLLFCGDTLFLGGCGRFFEGTAEQMLRNMDRFAALPGQTRVYCAHEYTASNMKFLRSLVDVESSTETTGGEGDEGESVSVLPRGAIFGRYQELALSRQRGLPTVPGTIEQEREYNLFMRCREPATQRLVGAATAVEAMAKLRQMKNTFVA